MIGEIRVIISKTIYSVGEKCHKNGVSESHIDSNPYADIP